MTHMLKRLPIILFLLLPGVSVAQSDQLSVVDPVDLAHPLTFKELNRSGDHKVKLVRSFANEKEEMLLRIAEATYPSENAAKNETAKGVQRSWWCDSIDGVRVPYAITRSAVAYYLEVSEEFVKGSNAFGPKMKSSNLEYLASLSRKETYKVGNENFRNVYVVSMDLVWLQNCGPLCAMVFKASRKVVLSAEGKVLAVENDKCAEVGVS
jgi:hypothetical protein